MLPCIRRAVGLAPLLFTSVACDSQVDLLAEAPALAANVPARSGSAAAAGPQDWAHVTVPAADGPKLAPLKVVTRVYAEPSQDSGAIGYLRVGARVARSEAPVSRRGCPDGWYAIRPVGFVCATGDATLNLDHPVARAIHVEPDRSKPMPYKYGFVRSIAPNYLRIPSKKEQFRYEMSLKRHLRSYRKLADEWDALDVGANDVPLDPAGLALGRIPDHALAMDMSERYGGDGDDEVPWWLKGERRIPNLSSFKAPPYAVIADRIKRHAGVALIGTFVAESAGLRRRFAISTDARLLPADKVKANSGSPFHGHDIEALGLPIAFAYDRDARYWSVQGSRLERGEQLEFRELVPLSGKLRRVGGVRMVETRDGRWLRSADLKTVAKPSKVPSWAKGRERWIDISIVNQTLVLWEGDTPVYATLVSTGRAGLAEAGTPLSTPMGTFRIYQKHVTTTMDSDAADSEFELRDVPWVMYFNGGYALHGAYWHDGFGRVRSHGCVNLAPIDARYIYLWSKPDTPPHWHSVNADSVFEGGTRVHIHP